jgi:allantoate deiminase
VSAALGAEADALLLELAAITSRPGMIARFYLTPEHRRAMDLVAAWMRAEGLDVSEDAVASVRGLWRCGKPDAKRLVLGSHIDTVVNAGRFDGPLGVVAPLLALREARKAGLQIGHDIEIIAFGDEEGSRFPATFAGSLALSGQFNPAALDGRDEDGISLREALISFGKSPDDIPKAAIARESFAGYLEVHIEQGPVLEAEGLSLGVVEAIVGQTRGVLTVTGVAGHAGTVPMAYRHDAFQAMAEMALALERRARDDRNGLVGTIGKVSIGPGLVNVIPDRAVFSIDVRSSVDATRVEAVSLFLDEAHAIAARRGCTLEYVEVQVAKRVACDPVFRAGLAEAIGLGGQKVRELPSGAGHDAQVMAALGPSAMLFVRCKGGVSHNPAEFATHEDMGDAIAALAAALPRIGNVRNDTD